METYGHRKAENIEWPATKTDVSKHDIRYAVRLIPDNDASKNN